VNLEQVSKLESKLLVATYDRYPVLLHKGRGVHLYDHKGRKYLDLLSGIGVNALGYAHPALTRTIAKQAKLLVHTSNLFYHEYQGRLAAALTKISGMDRAFFTNSGTEAWEGALKLARAYARANNSNGHKAKWRLLALENSFHGRTFGALSTTGQAKYRDPFMPLVPGVDFVAFNDVEDLKRQFDGSVCAVCVETIQGEGGINLVSQEFLQTARELTRKSDALLLLDEIQCGLGRTGKHFAYQQYGIQPDIVTVAKPLAAGLPLGALLTTNQVATAMQPGLHGTTFGGGPLACAVAIEVLKQMDQLKGHVSKLGSYFLGKLQDLQAKHVSVNSVRGIGMMLAIELDSADLAKAVVANLLANGILINRTHDTVLRFLPPYIIEKRHVDEVIKALDEALRAGAKGANHERQKGTKRKAVAA
jgi:acetylornithine aminotransferase/acetylornithine/N-succinyldiaminopimelate aminotransferase